MENLMGNNKLDRDLIMRKLKEVQDPELKRSIVDLGMVEDILEQNRSLTIKIKLTVAGCPLKDKISGDIKAALADLTEIDKIKIEFSAMTEEERKKLTRQITGKDPSELFHARGVKNVILVASGKGGVGKSTVTANLAASLALQGHKVGLLDADIYGFSIPRILGLNGRPTVIDNTIIPLEKHGLRVISMGFFIEENEAVIWRGPMVHKAVSQFLSDVFWDNLDFLLIDLPPGTGDVALSLAQTVKGVNAVLVTTPQPGAYMVASRIGKLVSKFNIRMLGIIENMSYFLAPDGSREYIFGSGGGQELSDKMGIPLLGQIPLATEVRSGGDNGIPIVLSENNTPAADMIREIAEKISGILAAGHDK